MTIQEYHRTLPRERAAKLSVPNDRVGDGRSIVIGRMIASKAHVASFTFEDVTIDERSVDVWAGWKRHFEELVLEGAPLLGRPEKKLKLRQIASASKVVAAPTKLTFSDRTLGLVKLGIIDTVETLQHVKVEDMFNGRVSDSRVSEYLEENLVLALISLADVFRQFGIKSRELSGSDGFVPTVDRYLFKGIPVSLKVFGAFSRHLCADLLEHLYRGGSISGAWGGLVQRDDKLVLNVEGEPSTMPPIGSRPTVYFDD